eukprot:2855057-Amphidinium_carterae.2
MHRHHEELQMLLGSGWREQDDVKKLRGSMGQARSTILTMIAVTMQGNPWWMKLVDDFLEKCPAQIEAEPKVRSFEQTLESVHGESVTMKSVRDLIPMSEALPSLEHSLRTGCLAVVLESFKSSVFHVWSICDTEIVLTSADTHDLTTLLQNALILWPNDEHLQEMSEAATQMMTRSSEEAWVKDILHIMYEVEKGSLDDADAFVAKVETLNEKLAGTSVDLQIYMTEGQNTGHHTATHLLDFLQKHWTQEKPLAEKFRALLVCVWNMLAFPSMTSSCRDWHPLCVVAMHACKQRWRHCI